MARAPSQTREVPGDDDVTNMVAPPDMSVSLAEGSQMKREGHCKKADLPASVDMRAIGHNYGMCCIENMTALMRRDVMSPPTFCPESGVPYAGGQDQQARFHSDG